MNLLLIALVATLRVAGASSTGTFGTLTTITTDTVQLPLRGDEWATAQFSVTAAGTATATSQVSLDGGINWIASAYAKRLSTVSANPTVQAISATTLVTGDVWEVPLPGNATHFRLLCGGTGTVTTVTISGGSPYVPGVPVVATLADVTEGSIGAGVAAVIYDMSGWNAAFAFGLSPTGQSWVFRAVDDAGSVFASAAAYTFTAAAGNALQLSRFVGGVGATGVSAFSVGPLPAKRMSLALAASGTVTAGRFHLEAFR